MWSDQWQGYSGLTAAGYIHERVNHSQHFVNPTHSLKKFKLLAQDIANRSASVSVMTGVEGELSTYSMAVAQLNYSNDIDFWVANTAVMPTLAPLALDIISAAPASQAYVEHILFILPISHQQLMSSVLKPVTLTVNANSSEYWKPQAKVKFVQEFVSDYRLTVMNVFICHHKYFKEMH